MTRGQGKKVQVTWCGCSGARAVPCDTLVVPVLACSVCLTHAALRILAASAFSFAVVVTVTTGPFYLTAPLHSLLRARTLDREARPNKLESHLTLSFGILN